MDIRKVVNWILILLLICLSAGIGAFVYNGSQSYTINRKFTSLPLQFNPETSSSLYQDLNVKVTVVNGFVKGLQQDRNGEKAIVIRALSPLPTLTIEGLNAHTQNLIIENVNPEFFAKSLEGQSPSMAKISANALKLSLSVDQGEAIELKPTLPSDSLKNHYVILGDNRDGYDTFEKMIQQVNGLDPAFVIDNGDLVFSGKPNQYRLFDKATANIAATLCTTLGNHDIRGNGRETYSKLFGPAYYSFDYAGKHFIFLDSSRGWAEQTAIPDEQYVWLEKDLIKAQGKPIFVISHIPPEDPRSEITPNVIQNYVNEAKSGQSWAEQKLDHYFENKGMDHGFQTKEEAVKFEALMRAYHVDTVYLSHIHSFFDYTKDGVRYVISGGAGAELLTKNSYYHYLISKFDDPKALTMVELPSPANSYAARYLATLQLFAKAMYEENLLAVTLLLAGVALLIVMVMVKLYLWRANVFNTLIKWLRDVIVFAARHFKEMFDSKSST